MDITKLRCIGYIDPNELPLAVGACRPYVIDEKGVDGCVIPVYIEYHSSRIFAEPSPLDEINNSAQNVVDL